jgi:phytoene/squalene synthetase
MFDYRDKKLFEYSDKICTALQLINFIQDTQIDIKKNRLYYPLNELRSFNITADDILNLNFNADVRDYFKFNVTRARDLLNSGKPLINYLKGNLAIEIKWTIFGGEEILNKIAKANYNVMSFRPTISKFNYAKIFLKSLF